MDKKPEDVALFDMDGTLCDYDGGLFEALEKLRSPQEESFRNFWRNDIPEYLRRRIDLIRSSEDWWVNLPKFCLGWDVLDIAKELEYRIMILTQGPRRNPSAWSGKKKWIDNSLGYDVDISITRDKSLVYGRILVDDFPGYINRWLEWRKNGLVIMPANASNENYRHEQVIRYDGENLEEVRKAMERVKRT